MKKKLILTAVLAVFGLLGVLRAAQQAKPAAADCCEGSACCVPGAACCANAR